MEYLEVVFDLKASVLDSILFDEFKLIENNVISSHFYDKKQERDMQFYDIHSFSKFFTQQGTGTIMFKELDLGIVLKEVLIVFSFDENSGTIDIGFPESELMENGILNKEKCLSIMNYFCSFAERYHIESVRFGYEPATDDNTCLIELRHGKMIFANSSFL